MAHCCVKKCSSINISRTHMYYSRYYYYYVRCCSFAFTTLWMNKNVDKTRYTIRPFCSTISSPKCILSIFARRQCCCSFIYLFYFYDYCVVEYRVWKRAFFVLYIFLFNAIVTIVRFYSRFYCILWGEKKIVTAERQNFDHGHFKAYCYIIAANLYIFFLFV